MKGQLNGQLPNGKGTASAMASLILEVLKHNEGLHTKTLRFERVNSPKSTVNNKKAKVLWRVYIDEEWKPTHQQTCVGKIENIADWMELLMKKPGNQIIYLSLQDDLGFHGMQYAFHEQ